MGTPFTVRIPAGSLGDQELGSGDPLTGAKQFHRHQATLRTNHGTAVAAVRQTVYAARAAGQLVEFRVGASVAPTGDSTVTVDVKKNNASVLTAPVVMDSGDAAYDLLDGAFNATPYVAGDVFEVVVTVSAGSGTLPQGLLCQLTVEERPS